MLTWKLRKVNGDLYLWARSCETLEECRSIINFIGNIVELLPYENVLQLMLNFLERFGDSILLDLSFLIEKLSIPIEKKALILKRFYFRGDPKVKNLAVFSICRLSSEFFEEFFELLIIICYDKHKKFRQMATHAIMEHLSGLDPENYKKAINALLASNITEAYLAILNSLIQVRKQISTNFVKLIFNRILRKPRVNILKKLLEALQFYWDVFNEKELIRLLRIIFLTIGENKQLMTSYIELLDLILENKNTRFVVQLYSKLLKLGKNPEIKMKIEDAFKKYLKL